MSQDAGAVANATKSVGGNFYAPNIFNENQVDYKAGTKLATLTSSNSLNYLNMGASGASAATFLL